MKYAHLTSQKPQKGPQGDCRHLSIKDTFLESEFCISLNVAIYLFRKKGYVKVYALNLIPDDRRAFSLLSEPWSER